MGKVKKKERGEGDFTPCTVLTVTMQTINLHQPLPLWYYSLSRTSASNIVHYIFLYTFLHKKCRVTFHNKKCKKNLIFTNFATVYTTFFTTFFFKKNFFLKK